MSLSIKRTKNNLDADSNATQDENNTTSHSDDEITKTQNEKPDKCENHLFKLKKKMKKMQMGYSRSTMT